MALALMKLASFAEPHIIYDTVMIINPYTGKTEPREQWESQQYDVKAMYVSAVKNWLKINPNIIALISQPQYKSAYFDFWKDFQEMAIQTFEFAGEGYSITPEPDEGDLVEVPEDDWTEYSFLD